MEVDKLVRICGCSVGPETERLVSNEATDFLKAAGNCMADSLIQLRSLLRISLEANMKENIEEGACVPAISSSDIAEADGCVESCVMRLLSVCEVDTPTTNDCVFMVLKSFFM